MVSFMDLFAGCFGDERRAKRGVFWPGDLWNSKARSCAAWGATGPPRWRSRDFFANRSVMPDETFAAAGSALAAREAGRHVLAIQDTTHLGFPRRTGSGLGPGGPKTIAYGWDQFKTMSQGWNLRQDV